METCYGSSTSYLMTWLWIPHASSRSSTYECGGLLRTFHLFSPRVSHSNTCRLLSLFVLCCCLSCCLVFVFLVPVLQVSLSYPSSIEQKKNLFCKCLGIPNSQRSLDLDDRQGLIARSAMQQKKKNLLKGVAPPALPLQSFAVGLAERSLPTWLFSTSSATPCLGPPHTLRAPKAAASLASLRVTSSN